MQFAHYKDGHSSNLGYRIVVYGKHLFAEQLQLCIHVAALGRGEDNIHQNLNQVRHTGILAKLQILRPKCIVKGFCKIVSINFSIEGYPTVHHSSFACHTLTASLQNTNTYGIITWNCNTFTIISICTVA